MSRTELIVNAAEAYVGLIGEIRQLKSKRRRCTEKSEGDWQCNDPGTPPCRYAEIKPEEFCDACKDNLELYRAIRCASHLRNLALRRLKRAVKNDQR